MSFSSGQEQLSVIRTGIRTRSGKDGNGLLWFIHPSCSDNAIYQTLLNVLFITVNIILLSLFSKLGRVICTRTGKDGNGFALLQWRLHCTRDTSRDKTKLYPDSQRLLV